MAAIPPKKVLIVSGEASGDHHGAKLVTAVRALHPEIEFLGMGGESMRAAGVDIRVDAKALAVVGLVEILRHIVPLYRAWKTLTRIIKHQPPDLLVLIDYPKFNLMLAKKAKQAGIKVLYYISPQVWAWHRSRVKTISERVDKMLVVFPFEEAIYREKGVPVKYVGHPLVGRVTPTKTSEQMRNEWQIASEQKVIGLLPGSRKGEIQRLLPEMLAAAEQLQQRYPNSVFILPLASTLTEADIQPYLQQTPLTLKIIPDQFYNAVQLCDAAIVASGTATLEVALLQVPMVIVYKIAAFTYMIAKRVIKVPYIGLCNIVAGKLIVKELIQEAATAHNMATEISCILEDESYRNSMVANMQAVKTKLGQGGGAEAAAQELLEILAVT